MEEIKLREFLHVDFTGDGDGSGSGSGYGYGYVSGYVSGIKSICGMAVNMIDGVPTIITHLHGNVAKGFIVDSDMSMTTTFVVKGQNLFAHGATLAEAVAALEEKIMENLPVEERLKAFKAKFSPGKTYTVAEFYDWHHRLTGSCTQGRDHFAQEHRLSMDDPMTPEEFIQLTKDAYGGAVIRQLAEYYGEEK
nr:MAG TPA_asm: hypothetical protein [Caudoviricetes sp.]